MKKAFISFLFFLILVICNHRISYSDNWDGVYPLATEMISSHDLTIKDTLYSVHTAKGLAWLSAIFNSEERFTQAPTGIYENFKSCIVEITDSIDLMNYLWNPIGNVNRPFMGEFRGNNYIVKNLKIIDYSKRGKDLYFGLFGYVKDALIQNIGIKNCTITTTIDNSGILYKHLISVGSLSGAIENTRIVNCFADVDSIIVTGDYLVRSGGLIGSSSEFDKIINCWVTARKLQNRLDPIQTIGLNQMDHVAGIIGFCNDSVEIANCLANVDEIYSTAKRSSGICSYLKLKKYISNCYSTIGNPDDKGNISHYISATPFISVLEGSLFELSDYQMYQLNQNVSKLNTARTDQDTYQLQYWDVNPSESIKMPHLLPPLNYWINMANQASSGLDYVLKDETESVDGLKWIEINTPIGLAFVALKYANPESISLPPDILSTKNIRLNTDIDLKGYTWFPIGNAENPFSGIFDGQGFTIKHLKNIQQDETNTSVGLFGKIQGATLQNLFLDSATVSLNTVYSKKQFNLSFLAANAENSFLYNCIVNHGEVHITNHSKTLYPQINFGGFIGIGRSNNEICNTYLNRSITIEAPSNNISIGEVIGKSEQIPTINYLFQKNEDGLTDYPIVGNNINFSIPTLLTLNKADAFTECLQLCTNNQAEELSTTTSANKSFVPFKLWKAKEGLPILTKENASVKHYDLKIEQENDITPNALLISSLTNKLTLDISTTLSETALDKLFSNIDEHLRILKMNAVSSKIMLEKWIKGYTHLTQISVLSDTEIDVEEIQKNSSNPNLLFFLNHAVKTQIPNLLYATSTGYIGDSIVLKDFYPFEYDTPFQAKVIEYKRVFNGISEACDWETICIPFDVERTFAINKTDQSLKKLLPFNQADLTIGNYWLKSYEENTEDSLLFKDETTMKANTSYIIAFPGPTFSEGYDLSNQEITFSAQNCFMDTTSHEYKTSIHDYDFICSYRTQKNYSDYPIAFTLFKENNQDYFENKPNAEIRPFQGYFRLTNTENIMNSSQFLTKKLFIENVFDIPTNNYSVQQNMNDPIYLERNELIVHASKAYLLPIWSIDGKLYRSCKIHQGINRIFLEPGIYIIKGEKRMVSN